MKVQNQLFFLAALLVAPLVSRAADKPLLAIPGKVIYDNKFDAALGEPWKVLKGKWEQVDGAWRVAEKPEDHHPAVARLPNKLGDFVIEYEFRFEGGKLNSLSINGPKGHMARILITPKFISIQKDSGDKNVSDKAVVFSRIPANFTDGTWHQVRMDMMGDTMLGQVDGLSGWGQSETFKLDRTVGLTVAGQSVDFRNFKICEAALNPEWDRVKANIANVSPNR